MRKKKGKTKNRTSESRVKELEGELKGYKERLLRLQAEFENYKKQLDRQKGEFAERANESLIKDLLGVLDDFERALMEKQKKGDKELLRGLELIYKNLFKVLEERGLKPIEVSGKKFDPYYHEVLLQEDSSKEGGVILEELQKGYLLNGKIIRHSKVKVSKKSKS